MISTVYVVVPTNEITNTMYEECLNYGDPNSIRKSLDGTLSILKFNTLFPETAKGYDKYTQSEILQILSTPEWSES